MLTPANPRRLRARALRALLLPTLRAVPWSPALTGAAAGLALAWLGAWVFRPGPGGLEPDPAGAMLWPRLAAIALATGAAFLLDDPAEETTLAAPLPLLHRRLVRLALALPALAASWAGVVLVLGDALRRAGVPARPLALEAGALATVAVAVAAVAAPRMPGRLGGIAAAPAAFALAASAFLLPDRLALYAVAVGPGAAPAQRRWLAVLVAGAVTLLAASRDPGRPRLARRWRRRWRRRRDVPGEVPGTDSQVGRVTGR